MYVWVFKIIYYSRNLMLSKAMGILNLGMGADLMSLNLSRGITFLEHAGEGEGLRGNPQ